MSINAVSVVKFFQAYWPCTVRSNVLSVPSPVTTPLSPGEPTNTVLSITHTPLPKSSLGDTALDINLSSITNLVLYIVAVKAPPDPTFLSVTVVSCRSKVVSPESNFISLSLANNSAPITTLVPS